MNINLRLTILLYKSHIDIIIMQIFNCLLLYVQALIQTEYNYLKTKAKNIIHFVFDNNLFILLKKKKKTIC